MPETLTATRLDGDNSRLFARYQPRPMRVAVVGGAGGGSALVRAFAALPQADLVAPTGSRPDSLEALPAAAFRADTTALYAELLASDVEAVAIAAPVNPHYSLVGQALLAGKHVLVEPPLTTNASEAAELTALADARGLVLMVGHTFLFAPAVEALRELVQAAELGDVWHVSTERLGFGPFRRDVNVLWDLAPHDVSILLHVLGAEPVATSARGACHVQRGIHDVAYLDLHYPDGMMAHVHVSWLDPGTVRRMTVVGSRQMAVYDDTAPDKLRLYDRGVVPASRNSGTLYCRMGQSAAVSLPAIDPLQHQCAHFLACCRGTARPRSSAHDALRIVCILERAERSLHAGGCLQPLDWDAARSPRRGEAPHTRAAASKPRYGAKRAPQAPRRARLDGAGAPRRAAERIPVSA